MYIINGAGKPNRSERALLEALGPYDYGVLITNHLLPGSRPLEVDAILVTGFGVVTIEVKGTGMSGALVPTANGDWTIGGRVADFAGGANPTLQARKQAQVVGGLLRGAGLNLPRVPAVVGVAGGDVHTTLSHLRDDLWVTSARDACEHAGNLVYQKTYKAFLDREWQAGRGFGGKVVTVPMVSQILKVLDVPPAKWPSPSQLAAECFPRELYVSPTRRSSPPPANHSHGQVAPHPAPSVTDSGFPAKALKIIAAITLGLGALLAAAVFGFLQVVHRPLDQQLDRIGAELALTCHRAGGQLTNDGIESGAPGWRVQDLDCTKPVPAAQMIALLRRSSVADAKVTATAGHGTDATGVTWNAGDWQRIDGQTEDLRVEVDQLTPGSARVGVSRLP